MDVIRYLDGHAENDEHEVGASKTHEEHVRDGLHGATPHNADDDQHVTRDAEQERESVRDTHGNQLPEQDRRQRVVVVVLIVVVVGAVVARLVRDGVR